MTRPPVETLISIIGGKAYTALLKDGRFQGENPVLIIEVLKMVMQTTHEELRKYE